MVSFACLWILQVFLLRLLFWFHSDSLLMINQGNTQYSYQYPQFNKIVSPRYAFSVWARHRKIKTKLKRNTRPKEIVNITQRLLDQK